MRGLHDRDSMRRTIWGARRRIVGVPPLLSFCPALLGLHDPAIQAFKYLGTALNNFSCQCPVDKLPYIT